MSLKKPFKEMDIQMLSQKVRRLEYWFKEDDPNYNKISGNDEAKLLYSH